MMDDGQGGEGMGEPIGEQIQKVKKNELNGITMEEEIKSNTKKQLKMRKVG